jgi:Do/DeqQ family serine protease
MRLKSTLLFVLRAAIGGLAVAFVLLVWKPELLQRDGNGAVEIRETAAEAALDRPAQGPYSYSVAVEKAAPAVVNINTAKVITVRPNPFFDDPVFRQFFGRDLGDTVEPRQRIETSLGSGVILNERGYVLTNHHVIRSADAIQVTLRDGRTAEAKVVGTDPDTDLAVLKVELDKLPVITLGRSERVRIGDVVLAIGNPFGVGQTVTMGIVSATGRNRLGINTFENFIQTDAAINPGNSGGALIDAAGDLIGINTAIFSKSGGSQGIGFAIPTSIAKGVLDEIIQHGRPLRGWLGVEAQAVTPEMALTLDLKGVEGIVVTGVTRNGPAHKAGLQPGDVIVAVDGKKIGEARGAMLAILSHRPGDKITLTVRRAGKELAIEAIAAERPARQVRSE